MLGQTVADTPGGDVAHSIAVVDANGFVAVSETITAEGAVIDTFQSGGTTIKVLGSPGSSASFYPTGPTKDQNGGLGIAMSSPGSKTDPLAYSNSGRTVVGDLMAMGVSRADAERLIGLETADGTNPAQSPLRRILPCPARHPLRDRRYLPLLQPSGIRNAPRLAPKAASCMDTAVRRFSSLTRAAPTGIWRPNINSPLIQPIHPCSPSD